MAEKKAGSGKVSAEGHAVRKIQEQANGSTTVVLPPDIVRELKWRDGQKVVVRRRSDTIVISDYKQAKKK